MASQADHESRTGQFGPFVYADWRASSLGEITEALEHRLIFRLTGSLGDRVVLDAGCDDGSLARAAVHEGAARVCGCDLDPRMVAKARATATRDAVPIDFAVARLQVLPFPDDTFDVVTCITVLAFVPDADTAVREMARVLRPGGRLVIGDLSKWSLWAARRRIRGWLGARLWQMAHRLLSGPSALIENPNSFGTWLISTGPPGLLIRAPRPAPAARSKDEQWRTHRRLHSPTRC